MAKKKRSLNEYRQTAGVDSNKNQVKKDYVHPNKGSETKWLVETPSYPAWYVQHVKKGWQGYLLVIGTIYGIFQAIYATPIVWEEWYYGHMPIYPLIGSYIAMYGFLFGIIYQPYSIYRRLYKKKR